ncbi:adenosylcobinamide kinase/adenosylcobinamide-phosphate guanylyltransferase [Calothrix sp. NIES-4071]|nr:adenosylcobinamide kinase/adenosylcobinamide-phosphate guanylyltransferase [Calothrix sp. NIES-4071]BAZ61788.1 adenosylcobinamide kinase/adenosylcobinamide-phosphate guanylyltransferase [Calothrix sp. NIES-4105]
MGKVTLITGPARSGKSEWAEKLALKSKNVVYIATSNRDANDPEWLSRIQQHLHRRPQNWLTLEVPIELSHALSNVNAQTCILVDSLGTWVANLLEQEDIEWDNTVQEFLNTVELVAADIVFVAEETGWGVVPAYLIGRKFRDRLGSLVRRLSKISDTVYLVTGGYALDLGVLGTAIDE